MIAELEGLRAEHQWFYHQVDRLPDAPEQTRAILPEQALTEMKQREQRMRAITEQLYLRSEKDDKMGYAPAVSLAGIRQALDEESTLIEYYNDGENVSAFRPR